jgi:hypothetical protein
MEHMLIAEEYDINKFAAKMQFVIDNPDFVMEIGLKGRSVANEIFNYKNKANEIDEFLGII